MPSSEITCSIDIIIGSMYSGKSTELLRRCKRFEAIGKNVLKINHIYDTRTDDSIQTHTNEKVRAMKTDKLLNIVFSNEFLNADIIGIDEAQFFTDLYDFVIYCESKNKSIIISGLDGDSKRKPFGQILMCIPLCDSVIKLKALDMIDKDGSSAIFSKRIVSDDDQVLIGSGDKYIAVSRKNYHTDTNNSSLKSSSSSVSLSNYSKDILDDFPNTIYNENTHLKRSGTITPIHNGNEVINYSQFI